MEIIRTQIQSSEVSFNKQENGYDITQVDAYIKSITEAYQSAYEQNNIICNKYNQLLENFKMLQMREQSRPSAEVISNTLLNAEMFSKKIITEAQAEADKLKKYAYMVRAAAEKQAQKLIDDATVEAAQVKDAAKRVFDAANAEAAMLKENSRIILDEARAEAAAMKNRSGKNIDQAYAKKARLVS